MDELRQELRDFVRGAGELWRDYQQQGPGKVAAQRFQAIESASSRLLAGELPEDVKSSVAELTELCRRCACRPEGLSFIAGEYGLIPRKDQHAKFETLLAALGNES